LVADHVSWGSERFTGERAAVGLRIVSVSIQSRTVGTSTDLIVNLYHNTLANDLLAEHEVILTGTATGQ
jgi:hypothetical protein